MEGSARSDYSVEQQPWSQLGSKNQSDFVAKVKFAASERQEGTGGTLQCCDPADKRLCLDLAAGVPLPVKALSH